MEKESTNSIISDLYKATKMFYDILEDEDKESYSITKVNNMFIQSLADKIVNDKADENDLNIVQKVIQSELLDDKIFILSEEQRKIFAHYVAYNFGIMDDTSRTIELLGNYIVPRCVDNSEESVKEHVDTINAMSKAIKAIELVDSSDDYISRSELIKWLCENNCSYRDKCVNDCKEIKYIKSMKSLVGIWKGEQ